MGVIFAVVLVFIWDGLPATYANDSDVNKLKVRHGNPHPASSRPFKTLLSTAPPYHPTTPPLRPGRAPS